MDIILSYNPHQSNFDNTHTYHIPCKARFHYMHSGTLMPSLAPVVLAEARAMRAQAFDSKGYSATSALLINNGTFFPFTGIYPVVFYRGV